MEEKKETRIARILSAIRKQFIIGFIVTIPLGVTLLVLLWIFETVDNFLQPFIELMLGRTIQGIGFVITVLFIYVAGIISSNVVGSQLIRFGEALVYRVPLARTIYRAVKQVVENFSGPSRANFLRVVLVEFPRKGVVTLAFITSETRDKSGSRLLSLLVPTAPNPLSGYVVVVPEKEVIETNIRVDEAMRMMISGGAILPSGTNGSVPMYNWPPSFPGKDTALSDKQEG
ncbi:MAG: DUF502 domain-containing protein [Chloroflexota bacterium]